MCNEYAREIEMARIIRYMEEMKDVPPFEYEAGRIPNDLAPQRSIKIRDKGVIARLRRDLLTADTMTWAWKTPGGKPVFNFVSEGRAFADSDRALILATGFYEYTAPKEAKVKLKDQHFFELTENEWFELLHNADCGTRPRYDTLSRTPDLRVASARWGGVAHIVPSRTRAASQPSAGNIQGDDPARTESRCGLGVHDARSQCRHSSLPQARARD